MAWFRLGCVGLAALLAGCGSDSDKTDDAGGSGYDDRTELVYEPIAGSPEAIAHEQDITRYLGTAPPTEKSSFEGVDTYTYDIEDGPMCLRGGVFRSSTRDQGSENLLIFLQGGGACWSDFCLAVTSAPEGIPASGLLNRENPDNPFASWNVAYSPYCDGSLFSGDNELDDDGDGENDRFHHGLQNLSAVLTMSYEKFPNPKNIVLAGASGGAYGTVLASFLVRYVYPEATITVVNDAGVGLGKDGDPSFVNQLINEFGAAEFVPDDCEGCLDNGHITGLVDYLLDRDDNFRVAVISSWYDFVISQVFLEIDPMDFQQPLDRETEKLSSEHPNNYFRFIYDGDAHTATLGDPTGIVGTDFGAVELPPGAIETLASLELETLGTATADGVVLKDWLAELEQGEAPQSRVDEATAPPE